MPPRLGRLRAMSDDRPEPPDHDSRRGALIGLAVTAALVVAAYFLVNALRESGRLQDCLMSGRTNCAPIDTGPAK
jgi:hypothetical protein